MAAVPYEEALATLQSMFGGLDRDLIADVLDSHGCQMEPTVDALLILSGAQGNSPREAQASGRPGHLTDSTRRSFSSADSNRRNYDAQERSAQGFGSNGAQSREDYQDALVSGSIKEKVATAPARTVSAGTAAMKKLTEVLADWGLTSRRSSSEYSLAHENDYLNTAAEDSPSPASTSYAGAAGSLVDKVQSATAEAIGGVSSSFRRMSTAKHRQRAGHEGESLLQHSDDFEDGVVLAKEDARQEERRSLNSTWERDEDEDEEFVKKEH